MWLKQQIQIALFPRIIKCLKYSYKGEYYMRFSVFHQSESGTKNCGFPKLISYKPQEQNMKHQYDQRRLSNPESISHNHRKMRDSQSINKNIKSSLMVSSHLKENQQRNKILEYRQKIMKDITRQKRIQKIYFENQQIEANDICVFQIQSKYKGKQLRKGDMDQDGSGKVLYSAIRNSKTKVYIEIELYLSKNGLTQDQKGKIQLVKNIRKVTTKRIYLNFSYDKNNKLEGINQFIKIQLSDPDFFTEISMLISSVNLGWKIRNNRYSLCQFYCLPRSEQLQVKKQKKVSSLKEAGLLIKKILGDDNSFERIVEFYRSTILKTKNWHKKIIQASMKIGFIQLDKAQDIWTKSLDEALLSQQNMRQYFKEYKSNDQLYFLILKETNCIVENIRIVWRRYCQQIMNLSLKVFENYCNTTIKEISNKWDSISIQKYQDEAINRKSLIKNFKKQREQFIMKLPIFENSYSSYPFISLKNYSSYKSLTLENKQYRIKQTHLVILVHGYQGTYHDLQKIGNYLSKNNEKVQLLYIKCLTEVKDTMNIDQMGEEVANEIKNQFIFNFQFQSISFIGYSLGGLILRSALLHLSQYREKMHMFVTFSSPHLGIFYHDNNFVKLGAWYLQKVQNDKAISQINTEKNIENSQKTYLKRLSEDISMSWFSKLVLISSKQDQFVPYYSASIAVQTKNQQVNRISENIRKRIKKIQEVQVWFDVQDKAKGIDKLTGRQSHIQFLDNDNFLRAFFALYGPQF